MPEEAHAQSGVTPARAAKPARKECEARITSQVRLSLIGQVQPERERNARRARNVPGQAQAESESVHESSCNCWRVRVYVCAPGHGTTEMNEYLATSIPYGRPGFVDPGIRVTCILARLSSLSL